MQKKHEPPLLLTVKPSKQLKRLLAVLHVLALASSFANTLPLAIKLSLSTIICIQLYYSVNRLQNDIYKIKHTEAMGWEIANNHDFKPIEILHSTVISLFAIFLHFNNNGKKQSALIASDALAEEDYRCLIVRLKTTGLAKESA
jgi:toxin CptA